MAGTISYVSGDCVRCEDVTGVPVIIAHVCNDRGGWGKGFVVALSERWSEPEAAYREWAKHAGSGEWVGLELGRVQQVAVGDGVWVMNMVAQHGYATPSVPVALSYEALGTCLGKLAEAASAAGAVVAMPRIGCGLAGGEWSQVEAVIAATLLAGGIDVFVFDLV
jgi:O-acetyl-ADP-ribose deacetylase (regulator of RNase III)